MHGASWAFCGPGNSALRGAALSQESVIELDSTRRRTETDDISALDSTFLCMHCL